MNIVTLDPAYGALIDHSWVAELDATPFLTRCREGRASFAELHSYVRQQSYYSRHFTRYLCALLVNITDEADRVELMHNLFEEMGFGDFGNVPHSVIYQCMMKTMGVVLGDEPENAATTRLVDTMLDLASDPNPLVGLAALGLGAEAIVPHVYSQIIRGFVLRGEPQENLEFFHIHVEGDDEHAVTMRKILEREIVADPTQRVVVRNAARRVITARTRFFDEIGAYTDLAATGTYGG
jgi:pyrroloquinoline quinone (PQQ) biosynthesis protein C